MISFDYEGRKGRSRDNETDCKGSCGKESEALQGGHLLMLNGACRSNKICHRNLRESFHGYHGVDAVLRTNVSGKQWKELKVIQRS